MWLFHDLGGQLRPKVQGAPERCDTRTLIKILVQNRPSPAVGERDPFNWFKELQTAANAWHHLPPESEISEDDVWRDLDTMERVAKYLDLAPAFIEHIRRAKEEVWAQKNAHEISVKDPMERPANPQDKSGPCPLCGSPTKARRSRKTGELYFGCTNYPNCTFKGCRSH